MKNYRSLLIIILLLFVFTGCALIGIHVKLHNPGKPGKYPEITEARKLLGELSRFRTCYDVKFYSLNITVDPAKKYLKGFVDIQSVATAEFDTLQIDLYPNMKLNSVQSGNSTLQYSRREGAIFVTMERKISAGEEFSLRLSYEGSPLIAPKPPWKGGFVWKKDKEKNPWIGVACETEGASLWWPNKDHTSDESDSTAINITVPFGLVAVSNGRLRDTISENGFTTYRWFAVNPVNNYDITLYIGKFVLFADQYYSKVTNSFLDLNHYILPANYEKAKVHFQQLKKQLDFYEMRFGPYPWYADGFKLVESPYAGMEHQSAIAYGNGFKNSYRGFDYIILHETAHEWWGNAVSAADLADGWLHEGFATYSEALYVEHTSGKEQSDDYLWEYRLFIKNKRPIVAPKGMRYFNYKDGDIYVKGAWVLHTLRNTIADDELFFSMLKMFAVDYRAKQISSADFEKHVNRRTKKDYGWFFRQYLEQRKVPVLEIGKSREGNYTYRWKETLDDFKMPVVVTLNGKKHYLTPTFTLQTMNLKAEKNDFFEFNDGSLLYKVDR